MPDLFRTSPEWYDAAMSPVLTPSSSDRRIIDLSLVLPLYNEGDVLLENLSMILMTLRRSRLSFEMLLIDDGSIDQTPRRAASFAGEHPDVITFVQHPKNLGRGATVNDGIRRARGTIVGFIDVDCETSPLYILDLVPRILDGSCDVITGHRYYPFTISAVTRVIASVTYRKLEALLLGTKFSDSQTGYKFFRRSTVLPLLDETRHPGWFWDTEIMAVCAAAKLRIAERPVLFLRDRRKRSTVRLIHDSLDMLQALLRYRHRYSALIRNYGRTSVRERELGLNESIPDKSS